MLDKLKKKWGVNTLDLVLIICTFALGGSLCGYVARKILGVFHIENRAIFTIAYIISMTILWPMCVIIVSIPFGQFKFFKNYLGRIKKKIFKSKN